MTRHTTRWNLSADAQKVYLAVLLSMRGSVCLYQGEELALPEADIAFEDLQDPYGIKFWPKFKGRDGCRTPMVWSSNARNGGFTEGKPWLPVAAEHAARAVDAQESDPDSMLNFYRHMIAYRKTRPELIKGGYQLVTAEKDYLALIREHDGKRLFCAFNLSDAPRKVDLPAGDWTVEKTAPFEVRMVDSGPELPGWAALFALEG